VNASGPDTLTIGCCAYRLEHWRGHWKKIAERHGVSDDVMEKIPMVLELASLGTFPIVQSKTNPPTPTKGASNG
jgi:hypothetical protein